MSDADPSHDEAYSALERLYDDPEERIAALRDIRTSEQDVTDQEAVFKALGNEDRLRVLSALRESECCGCELQIVLDAPQSTVATHLRKLREAGLVKSRKKGKWSYYRIADTAVFDLLDLAQAIEGDD
ncbi:MULTISPECIES: ArsR/SmtB family transcription factor [Halomicrobium]|uniref:Transcriptional regulator, ArsR family n=2 Tax=Halomicrobium mukohataei TaxID=57705 RepID=C7NYS3_HALMD|nr:MULTISPECIES: metalloregulator ArsR/SmtB family transcription factor [Halomicrobium]ACV48612.1 transcriptional regulator, ArsR family [Halomicrobium mukohataei DSM 12286]QCD67009.1 transcriptional regulator [Halomicrobium mukohataei]QFR21819.1 metalloregulator ArsR/SmtB family transcription factor [Halomicrobium sp. ZPS1]